jgi:hypothetical protein
MPEPEPEGRRVASYRSPKTEVRASPVEGRGLFARAPIARDEIVAIKGGHVVDEATYQRHKEVIGNSDIKIADGFHLAALDAEEYERVMLFLNHRCDPNVGVQGNSVFVAMRDVEPGEELTIDYAMIDDCDDRMECRCGAAGCRGVVTGRDWRIGELQRRYGRYFSTYLLGRSSGGSRRARSMRRGKIGRGHGPAGRQRPRRHAGAGWRWCWIGWCSVLARLDDPNARGRPRPGRGRPPRPALPIP